LPVAAAAITGLGELLYEWNELESAERRLETGIALGERWGNVETTVTGRVTLAQVRWAQGDLDTARHDLDRIEQTLQGRLTAPPTASAVVALRLRLETDAGRWDAAQRVAAGRGLSTSDALSYLRETEHLALARLLVAQGRAEVSPFIERLLDAARDGGRTGSVIRILAVQALALQRQGKTARALAVLEQALSLAEPQSYVRTFVDEGAPMQQLLAQISGAAQPYSQRLLAAFPPAAFGAVTSAGSETLIEPLSERELEVLRLIASGATNQQIADRLVIALGTVKAHCSNIYGKLGVSSRTQATARARDLGLV
jgi:LuxR family maltose regulon positive regulatory protein